MRDVIMWSLMTLDGCLEGSATWDLSFLDLVWGEGLERFNLEQPAGANALLLDAIVQ